MLNRIRKAEESDRGFTLIELLIVMIIIGILAAIAIPAFLNQKAKAKETSAKADVAAIGKEVSAYYVDGTGALTLGTSAGDWQLKDSASAIVASGKLSAGNTANASSAATNNVITSADSFCVSVVNGSTSPWKFSGKNGLVKGTCASGDL